MAMGPTTGEGNKYEGNYDLQGQGATWMQNHVFRVTIIPGFLGGDMASIESVLRKVGVPKIGALVSYEEKEGEDTKSGLLAKAASFFAFVDQLSSVQAYFTKASGMDMEFEYTPYREGGSTVTHQFFKGPKPQNLTFEYGMIVNSNTTDIVQAWLLAQRQGVRLMFSGTIELMTDKDFVVRRTWQFTNARLTKYKAATLEAGSNTGKDIIETLTFVHNGCY